MVAQGRERRGGKPKGKRHAPAKPQSADEQYSLPEPARLAKSLGSPKEADMDKSPYDETRATARLPNLDVEIVHRRPWEGNEEHLMVTLRAVPSDEALGRLLEVSNPLLVWTRMMEAMWSPWVGGLTTVLSPSVRPPSLPGFDLRSQRRADPAENRLSAPR